jgi:NADPH-dependent curcumin reductase CurA
MEMNQQWRLAKRPVTDLSEDDFEWSEQAIPPLQTGEVLIKHLYLSLDPTNRLWVNEEDSYFPAVVIGDVMRGGGVGVVEQSLNPRYKQGDFVQGMLNWQRYAIDDGSGISKIRVTEDLPITAYHGLFGPIGMTAYFGLMDIGKPRAGETLVVSAAAGAVGSLVGQMGKQAGCRVVGLAGSDEKCRWLTETLGFDAAINYKTANIRESLLATCPKGIDIYFDNVAGEILETVLEQINIGARIPLCGMISQYNNEGAITGPKNFANILMKRATLKGFIVIDYFQRAKEAFDYLEKGLRSGQLQYRVDVVDGLQSAPKALARLFNGSNTGKLIVKVDPSWQD